MKLVVLPIILVCRRSREGAWIEIISIKALSTEPSGRSREGAWIEIETRLTNTFLVESLPRGSVD